MASKTGTLYIGVTNDVFTRALQHKAGKTKGFTQKYKCTKLVYYEEFEYIEDAILREKQLKKWNSKKKESLIATLNPSWEDLADDWGHDVDPL